MIAKGRYNAPAFPVKGNIAFNTMMDAPRARYVSALFLLASFSLPYCTDSLFSATGALTPAEHGSSA